MTIDEEGAEEEVSVNHAGGARVVQNAASLWTREEFEKVSHVTTLVRDVFVKEEVEFDVSIAAMALLCAWTIAIGPSPEESLQRLQDTLRTLVGDATTFLQSDESAEEP